MKVERRGKYPGVKVHLEKDECEVFLELVKDHKKAGGHVYTQPTYFSLSVKMGQKIASLLKDEPALLEERTEEDIVAALSKEAIEADLKLKEIGKGADWKKIKVEVAK